MHNNLIEEISSLEKLFFIPNLKYLTIFSNPIASKAGIRHYLVNKISSLQALDFYVINDEERNGLHIYSSDQFTSMGPNTKLSWPLVSYPSTFQLSEQRYLDLMFLELEIINRKFLENNPIIRV